MKPISSGVAVYANGMWPAIKGRQALTHQLGRVGGREAPARRRSSRSIARWRGSPARWRASMAMPRRRSPSADKVIEAEFVFPYLGACADGAARRHLAVRDRQGGGALRQPDPDARPGAAIAHVLGLKPEQVEIETLLAGGSFGRRAQRQRATRRRACRGRESHRARPHREAGLDPRGRSSAAATTGRCSCTACAARCATARSWPGPTPSSGSPSSRARRSKA